MTAGFGAVVAAPEAPQPDTRLDGLHPGEEIEVAGTVSSIAGAVTIQPERITIISRKDAARFPAEGFCPGSEGCSLPGGSFSADEWLMRSCRLLNSVTPRVPAMEETVPVPPPISSPEMQAVIHIGCGPHSARGRPRRTRESRRHRSPTGIKPGKVIGGSGGRHRAPVTGSPL